MKIVLKVLSFVLLPSLVFANQPTDWQLSFQNPGSPLMQELVDFHSVVFWIITVITLFVFVLLAYVCVKFSAKNNKTPTKTTHNALLEVAWTLIPVLILVVIAIPSFRLLYKQNDFSNIDMTIKATGYTWYWGYEYPDHDDITFDSIMLQDDELKENQPRLLTTDNLLVLPVKKNIKVLITSDPSGVIHSWSVPSLGVKMDAIPGRLNETYFYINEPGMYYGQCSELCGSGHGFMPITVKAVTNEEFTSWLETAKEEFASNHKDKNLALK
ncbi:MAG: cytochrome c oxidase subunit II [Rickettsiales bacterium]|nr:cytochrome c oxidase subunit II [Rickettsiales bacterium]|tara:strand:- start:133 stop:942 length:810 start_codon:yes stop_codon:yes gene_type:complete